MTKYEQSFTMDKVKSLTNLNFTNELNYFRYNTDKEKKKIHKDFSSKNLSRKKFDFNFNHKQTSKIVSQQFNHKRKSRDPLVRNKQTSKSNIQQKANESKQKIVALKQFEESLKPNKIQKHVKQLQGQIQSVQPNRKQLATIEEQSPIKLPNNKAFKNQLMENEEKQESIESQNFVKTFESPPKTQLTEKSETEDLRKQNLCSLNFQSYAEDSCGQVETKQMQKKEKKVQPSVKLDGSKKLKTKQKSQGKFSNEKLLQRFQKKK